MTEISSIQSPHVQPSVLSQEDITRMPQSYNIPSNGLQADTYEPQQESHTGRNILITAFLAVAAIVGLKHCSFMQVEKGAKGFIANFIKKPITTVGGWIEWPFVKLAGILKSKDAKTASNTATDAAKALDTAGDTTKAVDDVIAATTDAAETATANAEKKGLFKRCTGWIGESLHSLKTWVTSIFNRNSTKQHN